MKVKDRMSTEVKVVQLDTSLTEAFRLMKESNIRRLPVQDKGQLVGIITLSDLNQAAPSSATSLSVHELNYLLAKTKIKDILPKKQNVITVTPETYIETAAKLMRKNKVSGLPVMDGDKLVGIITETDVFDALIDILGVKKPHSRLDVYISEAPGTLADLTGMISAKGINILNAVAYHDDKKDRYKAIIRVETLDCDDILKEIEKRGYDIESVLTVAKMEE
jgi:acetoin utilization protein AcuB